MSSLRDNLQDVQVAAAVTRPSVAGDAAGTAYRQIASDLHRQLLDRIDLDVMGKLPPDRLREELRLMVEKMIGAMMLEYLVMVNADPSYDQDDELVERTLRFVG